VISSDAPDINRR